MTSGKALAETVLREPMRMIGWQPRAAGWFTRQISVGFLGVIALGSASRYSRPGNARITLHAGIRDDAVEQVVSQLCNLKDGGYRQRTASCGIGYLMPGSSWREWDVNSGNAGELARQLAALVQVYAEPYLHRLSSDHTALIAAAKQSGDFPEATGLCRVAVLLAKHDRRDEAISFLREHANELETRSDAAAGHAREMAARTLLWLAAG